jgi:hypothetical protein
MGFRSNGYTIDNIFINRLIFKKLMNFIYIYIYIYMHNLFFDSAQAFVSVYRHKIIE